MATFATARGALRASSEHEFTSWDGAHLFYRAWMAAGTTDRAVVLFHRGHEHSGRFEELVQLLGLEDFHVFAWDARGHGRSPGDRGWAESFGGLVRDADAFVAFLSREYSIPVENMAVLAHSVGAVIATAWVHDYGPRIRALALAGPAFRVKLYVPFALVSLRALNLVKPKAFIQSYVKAKMLTHDPEQQASYQQDPLITRAIAVNILLGMHDASTRVVNDASAIHTPALVLSSGKDWVVKIPPQRRFFDALSSTAKDYRLYPGFYHDLLHEAGRAEPIVQIRKFLLEQFEKPVAAPKLESNRAVYEQLSKPLSIVSPRRWFWAMQKIFLKTLGRLSAGVRLGWRVGFDSGESLDYVYRDTAHGWVVLGKIIDRVYLNSPGWKGIRTRRVNLESMLADTIEAMHAAGTPVRILDVACGHGRYVLETLERLRHIPGTAELRDWDERNVDAARQLAHDMEIDRAKFERGDAFDRESLAAIDPSPTLTIVSGLYELFPDNAMVERSLGGIAAAMREGGYLIYTNQPWHPQVEMIARVLKNRDGKPWVMRCRSQAEMDELARRAGFEKIQTLTDEHGIFTVSLARRAVSR